jgi:GNAT superfamily N-acetyltransferase
MALIIRKLREDDLTEADRIFRCAFGAQFRLVDPMTAFGDADYVYGRWRANPENSYAAEQDGRLVGSNFTTRWGTVGFFGPLTVDPTAWGRGIGKRLVEEAVRQLDRWNLTHRGLFTFADSPKHISLYRGFRFWPRFLTALMSHAPPPASGHRNYRLWSELDSRQRLEANARCVSLTDTVYPGLDVTCEIDAVASLLLGDTILLEDGDRLDGLAVCHIGPRTEAGSDVCYVKFAAARPSATIADAFTRLIAACEQFAAGRLCKRVLCGMNYGRIEALKTLVGLGYQTESLGVTMHGDNAPGYSEPGKMVIDDWR